MTKMLIVSSETPEEDVQAAFTIVRESLKDNKLEQITWYSNFARGIVKLDERISKLEADFKMFAECHNQFGIETRAVLEKLTKIEKVLNEPKPKEEKKK